MSMNLDKTDVGKENRDEQKPKKKISPFLNKLYKIIQVGKIIN